jgi:dUTP pyrophosphatase
MYINIKIQKVHPLAKCPEYAHEFDAGMDLFSVEEKLLGPGESGLIGTGLKIALPEYTEAQIRPRSGLALNHQITVLNSPGTIDSGYRGEIGVILINHGLSPFKIEVGMKIAQMVFVSVLRGELWVVDELDGTSRGECGFGSSGI